jgi:blocked-early-in-transport protein 1
MGPYAPSGQRYVDDLEGQNDEALEGLGAKVKMLKDVGRILLFLYSPLKIMAFDDQQLSVGIGNEVRESTIQLSQMVRRVSSSQFTISSVS